MRVGNGVPAAFGVPVATGPMLGAVGWLWGQTNPETGELRLRGAGTAQPHATPCPQL